MCKEHGWRYKPKRVTRSKNQYVNRKMRTTYNEKRKNDINSGDNDANTLLSLAHTGREAKKRKRYVMEGKEYKPPGKKDTINFDCAAVVHGIRGNMSIVSSNSNIVNQTHVNRMQRTKRRKFKPIIVKGEKDQHAEMKILQYMKNHDISTFGVPIGVSKPCCSNCAQELKKAHMTYTHWHDDPVKKWAPPRKRRKIEKKPK